MSALPQTREQYSAHIPALHLLINLGWHFLSTAQALALRGSTREVILKPRLIEVLQTRRFDYKGESFPLSPSGIDQILRQVQAVNLTEGLLPANERVYQMLTLGVTVTEFMPDGKKHQPTIALIDWHDPTANRWDVTEELEVLSTHGTHHRVPDVVAYVNGLPLVVIEAKRPDASHMGQAMVEEGISQQLRNQRPDEIAQLFAYAQLLLAVSPTEARYGTTSTPMKFWARWREEQFSDAQLHEWKNLPLSTDAEAALLAGKPSKLQSYFRQLWTQPLLPNEQDRLLAALLHPQRLLEYLPRPTRRVSIHVSPEGGVQVDAPEGAALPEVKQAVRKRAAWIWQQLEAVKRRRLHVLPREYVSGETHFYLGRRHMLKVLRAEGPESGVRLWRGRLEIMAARPDALAVRKLLEDWYRQRAADVFSKVLLEMAPRLGLRRTLPPVRLLSMRTQWGSCSPTGEILLNPSLVKAPRPCIEYVVAHELSHLREHNHSDRFYKHLARALPDWEARKAELDELAELLLNR